MTTPRLRGQLPAWVLVIATVAAAAVALTILAVLGSRSLPERTGPPVEELAIERTVLSPGIIELTVRNTGPDPVQIAQVSVNDVYVGFTGSTEPLGRLATDTLRLDYPWQEGQPYGVSILTSTGAVIEHEVPVAVETPATGGGLLALMVLLGTYVGVLPVALGMVFLPVLRRAGRSVVRVLLALTVGLLAFLAVDAAIEGLELADESGGAFGGPLLVFLGAGLAFLVLTAVDRFLKNRTPEQTGVTPDGRRLALMIALGIGLHNLGEGLAIGSAYAVGELALGAALVVGFALHNTTEGLAVVAPLTRQPPSVLRLLGLGLLAGGPAILGAVIGAAVNNTALASLLFGVGVGAILQVVLQIAPSLRNQAGKLLDPPIAAGISTGVLIMYATGLLVSA
ncbi:zinc transporter ZupT [Kribbella sp. VKM Ac-2527]|uniref:Zinc transporter ZupT n=1 Tax=Kribbella caucasensis TaxID=2512215 RepID=A0A4R6J9B3_9ACTN|nr:ZIP family metal transporter [Kribbella sp. VKM Ac-2527]TDO30995.1 zinc transporter ZupT [Kribbella sp. VKM Ac-2527]